MKTVGERLGEDVGSLGDSLPGGHGAGSQLGSGGQRRLILLLDAKPQRIVSQT